MCLFIKTKKGRLYGFKENISQAPPFVLETVFFFFECLGMNGDFGGTDLLWQGLTHR